MQDNNERDNPNDMFKNTSFSKKKAKLNTNAQKYDYLKAAREMSNSPMPENIAQYQLRMSGVRRYMIVFTAFCFVGMLNGTCRARIKHYWTSKKYEDLFKNEPYPTKEPGGLISVAPVIHAIPKNEIA